MNFLNSIIICSICLSVILSNGFFCRRRSFTPDGNSYFSSLKSDSTVWTGRLKIIFSGIFNSLGFSLYESVIEKFCVLVMTPFSLGSITDNIGKGII